MNSIGQPTIKQEMADLCQGFDALGISYNKEIIQKFQKYIEVLYEYRKKLHLLSNQDYKRIAKKHFLTALMAFRYLKDHQVVCDIGAGAGFPSVPLKIVRQNIELTLFESVKKKAEFLSYLKRELGISDIEVINERAEHYREKKFDIILLKAVGRIKKLMNVIDHLMVPDGVAIFYKTHQVENEIKAADKELIKKGFKIQIDKLRTPVERLPLALVIVRRRRR